jgi:hypothetical protein
MAAQPGQGPSVASAGEWAGWYRGTGIARVLRWWFTPGQKESAPPPLPAWSAPDRVLAVLRADWLAKGDFLAVDHRDARSPCRFELFGGGRTWLGPEWAECSPSLAGPESRPTPSRWNTGPAADLAEWTYRAGGMRLTRSLLLLRGRRLALISLQAERAKPLSEANLELRLSLPPAVSASPLKGSRARVLADPERRGAGSAQALPIALPGLPYPTERGAFLAEGRDLILRQSPAGRRSWLPLLVSWDPARHRKAPSWRMLTVSEKSRAVAADRAFAVRVGWGRDETYVIYRSLGPPGRRAFLGHQSTARFLVGEFTTDGELKPIFTVE